MAAGRHRALALLGRPALLPEQRVEAPLATSLRGHAYRKTKQKRMAGMPWF
jgi:hypothetical protein